MKSLILASAAAGAILAVAAAQGATAQPAPDGAALFDARCKMCHEGGSAPSKASLASHTPAQIVDILTNGVMAPMAAGLSDADKRAIAAHITAGAAPAAPQATTPPPAQSTADGAALFDARCKLCHEGGSAPSKAVLAGHTTAQIVDILTNGVMAPMAAGLSDGEKRAIATYITAGAATAPPTAPTAPASAPAQTTPSTPTP